MLDRCGAVTALGLRDLVRLPLRLNLENGQILSLVSEQHAVTDHHIVAIGVHHNRQAEELPSRKTVAGHHRVVILLVHESPQGRKATNNKELHITGVAIGALKGLAG